MKNLLTSIIIQSLGSMLEKIQKFSNVGNQAATYSGLSDVIEAKNICKEVLSHAGWKEFEDFEATIFDAGDSGSACGFLNRGIRMNMYKLFFNRAVSKDAAGKKITDETMSQLDQLQKMLGIVESDVAFEFKSYFGPELAKSLTSASEEISKGNATPELIKTLKDDIDRVIVDYRLDDELVKFYSYPLYREAAIEVALRSPGGIPSKDDIHTLESLQKLLDVDKDTAQEVACDAYADTYKKAIKEALGSTGVIAEEYRKPLDELRGRLGMSEEKCTEIYVSAMSERFKPMVEYIAGEMERLVLTQDQLAQKRGKDYGQDYFKSGSSANVSTFVGITFCQLASQIFEYSQFFNKSFPFT